MHINLCTRLLAAAAVLSLGTASANAHSISSETTGAIGANPLADSVRAANDRFQDVAKAVAEGYAPIPCASSPTGGAMGIHYVNADYLKDDAVDVARPEAVMYEPMADGTLALGGGRIHHVERSGRAAGAIVQLQQRPQPLRSGPVLRTACVGVESEPDRRVCRQQPDGVLRCCEGRAVVL